MPLIEPDDPVRQADLATIRELRSDLNAANRELAHEREQKVRIETAIQHAARAAFSAWDPPAIRDPQPDPRKHGEEVAVVACSDWHYGAKTPDFNRDVCERRVNQYIDKVLSLTAIQRADHPVRTFRMWCLGDMGTGEDVYLGQEHEIDAPAIEQAFGAARLISDAAMRLLGEGGFDSGEVVCLPGNHSLGSTKRSPYHPDTNLDRFAYIAARERTRTDRITWNIARAEGGDSGRILVDRIGAYSCLLTHGDLFRGAGGMAQIPFYAMTVKPLRWRDMSLAGQMPGFKDLACGHWHKTLKYPIGSMFLRICGTLQTYDPFSREQIAAATLPQQTLMFVHPEAGRVTAEYTVNLA
jgi:hypothetical protein